MAAVFEGHRRRGGEWVRPSAGNPWPRVMVLPSALKHGVPWQVALGVIGDPERLEVPTQGRTSEAHDRTRLIVGEYGGRFYQIGIETAVDPSTGKEVAKLFHAVPLQSDEGV